ncbi:hypothetical protein HZC31_03615 [Candidatus Woesearchaeota archaeon]|nr:hypothetical protein [Candidatus Woesearchaeota archaeon]
MLNISAAVTDEWLNVDVVLANITYPDNTTKEQLRLQKVGGIYNFSFGNTTQNGIYNITFIANDTAGNLNFTQKTNITVDGLSPTVINVRPTPNNFTFVGSRINISAAVTDNLGISTVFANVTYPNNTTKEQLLLISVGSIFNYSFGNTSAEGYYNITFTATDLLGNINATEKTNVTVDSTGPAVRDATPVVNTSVTLNETVNISALVTDLFLSVDTVLANITYPNGSKEQLLMQKTGNIYNYTWTNVTQSGVYTITFIANDSLGNRNETQTASFRRITYNEDEPHFDLLNSDNASVTSYTSSLISNNSGLLTKQLDFSNFTFSRILILDFNESSYNSVMKVENATVDAGFSSTFAIDFSGLDFRSANVTVTAVGDEVYKCANFSFDTRTCLGSYVFLQTVVPGQNYTIVLNALDPGFGEKVSESEPSPAPAQEKSAAAAGGGAGGAGGLNDHIPSTVAAPEISAPDVPVLPTISIEVPFFTSIVPREESPLAEKKGLLSLALEEDGISFMRVLMYLLLVLFVTAGIFSFVSFTDIHVYRKTGFTALQQALIPFYIFRDALMYGWIILHHLKENIIGARYPHLEIKFFVRITLEEWKFALKEWSTRKAILLPVKYRFLEKVLRVE